MRSLACLESLPQVWDHGVVDTEEGPDRSDSDPFKPIDVKARNTEVLPEEAAERPPFLFWVPLVVRIILNRAAIAHQALTIAHHFF